MRESNGVGFIYCADPSSRTKIDYSYRPTVTFTNNIFRLDITMYKSPLVKLMYRLSYIRK